MKIINNLRNRYVLLSLTIVISLLVTSLFIIPVDSGSEAVTEMEETSLSEVVTTTVVATTQDTNTTATTSTTIVTETSTTEVTTTEVIETSTEPATVQAATEIPATEELTEAEPNTEEEAIIPQIGEAAYMKVTEPEKEAEPEEEPVKLTAYDYGLDDNDIILLRKIVSSEYGADWVPVEEKAKIVAAVMTRVNNPAYPSTVAEVLRRGCEPWGFNPNKNYYMSDSIIAAVDYYFENKDTVFANWTYTSWWGDGSTNHFH